MAKKVAEIEVAKAEPAFYKVHIKGATALMLHNARMADPMNTCVRAIKAITDKKGAEKNKNPDADTAEKSRLEWYGSMYLDGRGRPCIPGVNLEACIRDGAKATNNGKNVQRGVEIINDAPIIYDGPESVDDLYQLGTFSDTRPVRVNNGKSVVMRTRPIFHQWELKFELYSTGELSEDSILAALETAGARVALGDYRPRHGKFTVVSFKRA